MSDAGQVEDQYRVISLAGAITVPFGTFLNALVTREIAVLEPLSSCRCTT